MRHLLLSGSGARYELVRLLDPKSPERALVFPCTETAMGFLAPWMEDPFGRALLREWAAGEPFVATASRLSDPEALVLLSRRLVDGTLKVVARPRPYFAFPPAGEAPREPDPAPRRAAPEEEVDFWVRLDVNPNDASSFDDLFVLTSTDGSYRAQKTVKDDQMPGDESVDLHFTGLKRSKSYTLKAHPSPGAAPVTLFEGVAYDSLAGLSAGDSSSGPGEGSDETSTETLLDKLI